MLVDGSFRLAGEETVPPSLRGMPIFLREMLPAGVLGLLTEDDQNHMAELPGTREAIKRSGNPSLL